MVHELGHSMSLRHAPCGLLFDPDPNYPYPSGEIGVWGYDFGRTAWCLPTLPT